MNRSTKHTGFIIPVVFLTVQATAWAGNPVTDSWKAWDSWQIDAKVGDDPHFKISVQVYPENETSNATSLRFYSSTGPDSVKGKPFRVYLNKDTGFVSRAVGEEGQSSLATENAGCTAFIVPAPEGLPLEWFNGKDLPAGKLEVAGSKKTIEIRKEQSGDKYVLEMILEDDGVEQLRVKQEWAVGERWCRIYERLVNGKVQLTAQRVSPGDGRSAGRGSASGTVLKPPVQASGPQGSTLKPRPPPVKAPDPSKAYLADERLKVKLKLVAKHPSLEEMLGKLAEATDLQFTAHDELLESQPEFEEMYLSSIAASSLMAHIAGKYPKGTYWQKSDDGYMLTTPTLWAGKESGDSAGADPSEGSFSKRWILWSALGLMVLGTSVIAVGLVRRRRTKALAVAGVAKSVQPKKSISTPTVPAVSRRR